MTPRADSFKERQRSFALMAVTISTVTMVRGSTNSRRLSSARRPFLILMVVVLRGRTRCEHSVSSRQHGYDHLNLVGSRRN